MGKQSSAKTIYKHFALWLIWFTFNTLQVVKIIAHQKLIFWMQLAYNYLSLVIVFYAITGTLTTFFKYYALGIRSNKYRHKIFYIFNTQLLLIVVIIVAYILVSIFMDTNFFENIYPDYFFHFFQRFNRVLAYIFAAIGYAYFLFYKNKQITKNIMNEERITMWQERSQEMEQIIWELKNNRNSLLN
jgi:hypothetical protein